MMYLNLLVVGLAPVLQGARDAVLGVDGVSDPDASKLEAENKALSSEVSRLRLLLEKHGLVQEESGEGLDEDVNLGEDASCCCKLGRCVPDEQGADGCRAVEVFDPDRCCKRLATSTDQCPAPWTAQVSDPDCTSADKQMLDALLAEVVSSKGHTKQQCRSQLSAVFRGITDWASELSFHGHWIHSINARHFSETVAAQLFVSGIPTGARALPARLFKMRQATKLLWSGISRDSRAMWKTNSDAGELSEDTEMGHVIHQKLGDRLFDCCDFGATVLTFWQTASSSLLNAQPQKPLLVLVNKTQEQITSTIFWNAELPSLAMNPPQSAIRLVSFQMSCRDLVVKLSERVEEIVGNTRAAELRWSAVTQMTCEKPSDQAQEYPPPLWRAERLRARGLGPEYLGKLGMTAEWLHKRGFTFKDLRDAGKTLGQIHDAYKREHIKWNLNVTELKESGFLLADILKLHNYAAQNLNMFREAGFSARQLLDAASLTQRGPGKKLKALFSAKNLKEAGYSAAELSEAGFNLEAWRDKFRRPANQLYGELRQAHYTGSELKTAGFSAQDLKKTWADPTKYMDGFSCEELKAGGFKQHQLASVC